MAIGSRVFRVHQRQREERTAVIWRRRKGGQSGQVRRDRHPLNDSTIRLTLKADTDARGGWTAKLPKLRRHRGEQLHRGSRDGSCELDWATPKGQLDAPSSAKEVRHHWEVAA